MNRPMRFGSMMIALLGLVVVVGCGSGGSGSNGGSGSTGGGATSSAASAPDTIIIKDFMFSPMTLTVSPGTKVTVTNQDSAPHTVTATGDKAFDTGDIAPGKTTTFTAPGKPGSYAYICDIHQYMTGTLAVK